MACLLQVPALPHSQSEFVSVKGRSVILPVPTRSRCAKWSCFVFLLALLECKLPKSHGFCCFHLCLILGAWSRAGYIIVSTEKNIHNLKLKNCILLGGLAEDSTPAYKLREL